MIKMKRNIKPNSNHKTLLVPKLSKQQMYVLYFFLYAFIGWTLETLYAIYELGGFHKRGFLFGPICPLYGFGALILLIFLSNYKKNSIKLFFIAAIVFSVFEYVVGYALDAMFGLKWWDYTNEFFNLNGRISIFFSVVWGIIAILFINHLHPFIEKKVTLFIEKIPYPIQVTILKVIFIAFSTDTVLSCIRYLSVKML